MNAFLTNMGFLSLFGFLQSTVSTPAPTPQPEITQVTPVDDVNGSLHSTYFLLSDANGRVGIYFSVPRPEIAQYQCVDGNALVTGTDGHYVIFSVSDSDRRCFWFNTGTETQPAVAANSFVEVSSSPGWSAATNALNLASYSGGTSDAENVIYTSTGNGDLPDAECSIGSVLILQNGQGTASAPGGVSRSIEIVLSVNAAAEDIIFAVTSTMIGDTGFAVSDDTTHLDFTDLADGARLDASAGTSGFTITIIQQGA